MLPPPVGCVDPIESILEALSTWARVSELDRVFAVLTSRADACMRAPGWPVATCCRHYPLFIESCVLIAVDIMYTWGTAAAAAAVRTPCRCRPPWAPIVHVIGLQALDELRGGLHIRVCAAAMHVCCTLLQANPPVLQHRCQLMPTS